MSLFKYLPKEYVKRFLSRGDLKIGTLHEYRQIELYGNAIGDDDEGILHTSFEMAGGGVIDMGSKSKEASYLRSIPTFAGLGAGVTIRMGDTGVITHQIQSPDFYIFCTTSEFDVSSMNKFGGACFEITHPEEFFKVISRTIRHKGQLLGTSPITYSSRDTNWEKPHTIHPGMIKDTSYAYQKEVRTSWTPIKKSIKPLFIKVPDAIKYCRPMPRT